MGTQIFWPAGERGDGVVGNPRTNRGRSTERMTILNPEHGGRGSTDCADTHSLEPDLDTDGLDTDGLEADGLETDRSDADRIEELVAAAKSMVVPGERHVLGITGAPGSGKSTLAALLVQSLGKDALLVSMDGFHLANEELHRLDRHPRKGAPDTFDAAGYVALLRRLRDRTDPVVYAPRFDRALEESIGSAVPVDRDVPLIITEGNYLLTDGPDWSAVRPLLDECWYVDPGENVRLDRLIARHIGFGRSPQEALDRSHGSDGRNAELIRASRARASRIVRVPALDLS